MNLCQYRDIFGRPKEGAHSYRLFNIAIVDLLLTILGTILIGYYLQVDYVLLFILMMVLALIMHKIFCVETTLTQITFGK